MAFKMRGFSPFKDGFFKRFKEKGFKSAIKGSLPYRAGGVLLKEYGNLPKNIKKQMKKK